MVYDLEVLNITMKFSFIGGDLRMCAACSYISEHGFPTDTFLLDEADCLSDTQKCEHFPLSSCYVLPLPASSDGKLIHSPLSSQSLSISDFFSLLPKGALLFGGLFSEEFHTLARRHNISLFDYYKEEVLQIKNAVPTAEGALEIAMHELPVTIHGTNSLVIGYGRITRALAPLLAACGSHVTVSSRSSEGKAWCKAAGYTTVDSSSLSGVLSHMDVIFNTAPARVLSDNLLKNIRPDSLIIDLASRPGGLDMESAAAQGLHVIWALSLPGKCAPVSAGRIIGSTILDILGR